jgi:hypothetical protein
MILVDCCAVPISYLSLPLTPSVTMDNNEFIVQGI